MGTRATAAGRGGKEPAVVPMMPRLPMITMAAGLPAGLFAVER